MKSPLILKALQRLVTILLGMMVSLGKKMKMALILSLLLAKEVVPVFGGHLKTTCMMNHMHGGPLMVAEAKTCQNFACGACKTAV